MVDNINKVPRSVGYSDMVITQMCFAFLQFSVLGFAQSLFLIVPLLINLSFQIIYLFVLKIRAEKLKQKYNFHASVLYLFSSLGFFLVFAYTIDSTIKLKTLVFIVLLFVSALIILLVKIISIKKTVGSKKQKSSKKVVLLNQKVMRIAILPAILFCSIDIIDVSLFLRFCSLILGLLFVFPFAYQICNRNNLGRTEK